MSLPVRAPRPQDPPEPLRWERSPYMTDGTDLYRFVGWLTRGRLAEVEDCRSLAILVLSVQEIEASRLVPIRCESC